MTICHCPRCGEPVPAEQAPPSLRCSAEVYEKLGRSLARRRQERFVVVALDARNRPIRCHVVAVGSVAAVVVHPREVFAPLIRDRAVAAIVLHNHPSGGPVEPSVEDAEITRRLADVGRLLGIPLLDHVIVGKNGYCSMRDLGQVRFP
ncbi:MAG: JAB domain-containing protein [Deltaproteobacteria bacterium]|nr:JAB domain-containing protein [Deltaproteobacteria bacterium]